MSQATGRDMKKLADKERRQIEEAHRAKAAALRDDDNVFDVAYEQQGSEGQDVLSATDIKVSDSAHSNYPPPAASIIAGTLAWVLQIHFGVHLVPRE